MNPETIFCAPADRPIGCIRAANPDESSADDGQPRDNEDAGAKALRIAHGIVRSKAVKARRLPSDIFSDPAWDMLIEIFVADATGRRLSVTDVCSVGGIPSSTGQRYLRRMADIGLIVRAVDPRDRRRTFLDLAAQSRETITSLLIRMDLASAAER